ncbi:MAG: enoyl-CoA hydratase-related protein [Dehalococcoidia bacterium]|nr:enoyl-CoA hydratase-related protein [Dehalococcoidia bacterium]
MPDYTDITYERDGGLAIVTLNRPQYRNAQSRRLLEKLDDAFTVAEKDDSVRALVLTGEGEHFSAGHDLGTPEEQADREQRPYEDGVRGKFRRSDELYIETGLRWRNFPKPAIAAVRGYCIYGGWMVASACDVIFAGEDARFLPTNFQYFSVPWDINPRKLKAILFEGRFLDAHEARELGFVEDVLPPERLWEHTLAYARRVAENDPFQMRMTKLAINQHQETQGFSAHIRAAHAMYILSSTGESDPGFAINRPDGRRRPMVQRALDNYERRQAAQHGPGE